MNGFRAPLQIVIYCYRQTAQGPEFLYLKKSEQSGGYWEAIVGAPEKGEDMEKAALREVQSFCGLKLSAARQLDYLGSVMIGPENRSLYHPGLQRIDQYVFLIEVPPKAEIKLSSQFSEFSWTSADQGFKLLKSVSHKEALQVCVEEI